MTNEEAIKELREASDNETRYGDTEHHYDEVMKRIEAFNMAIKALEQQPCEDCFTDDEKRIFLASVSREMRICEQIDSENTKVKLVPILERVKDKVLNSSLWEEKIPSVTPKPGWIPCGERLPEETDDLVLGIDSLGIIRIAEIWNDCGQLKWYADGNYDVPIIAWMPVPPYKGVNENG